MNKSNEQIFFSVIIVSVLIVLGGVFVSGQENQTETGNFLVLDNETNTTETNQSEIFEESNMAEESTNTAEEQTIETNTSITSNETETQETENATIILVCSQVQCDTGCTICSDGSCHAPEEQCIEALTVEKITPATIKVGEQQLNILVKNTGTVALFSVEAEVSGYGMTTIEKLSIEALPAGEKDYTFTKVLAESAGVYDLIVKVYANKVLVTQEIFSVTVTEEEQEEAENVVLFNQSAALAALNETRTEYNVIEREYYEKEKQEYLVFGIDKDLVEIKEYLRQAQVAVIEQDEKGFQKNILAAQTTIENVAAELESAQKEDKTFMEILSENLALIGSLFGVLISGVTVWSMTKVHLKKAKIVNIIKGKQIVNVGKNTEMENVVESDEGKAKDL